MVSKEYPHTILLNFSESLGSAGGYKKGLAEAYRQGYSWFWLMDDDVRADEEALNFLVMISQLSDSMVYASVGLDQNHTGYLCWHNTIYLDKHEKYITKYEELGQTDLVESTGIGYMGLFLPRMVVDTVGYPDDKLFIWADDVDYYIRIKQAGFKMVYVRESIVYHPKANYCQINFLIKKVWIVFSSPWKEYYAIRNNIFLWMKYNSKVKVLFLKIPRQIILYALLVLVRDQKVCRLKYYMLAFYHGLIGKLGKTVLPED
jgi:rhamnopyranosyl-N-acetylglucosaminyl-diphospho-decaprenol beta-1,3/1,4-galactofuranosyltransferase